MRWFHILPLRLRSLFRRSQVEQDLENELQFHLSELEGRHVACGLAPEDARRLALRETRSMEAVKDWCRDTRGTGWIEDATRDVSYAVRALRQHPAFAAVTILTLALGIGANTAIFTLVDTVLLKKLPVETPDELVVLTNPTVSGAGGGLVLGERSHVSFDEYEALRDRMESFTGILAAQAYTASERASINGQPAEEVRAKMVSGNYFAMLGVPAFVGRTFTTDDEHGPGTSPYAVISYAYWQRRFGGAGSALEARVKIGNADLAIVGVSPPGFFGESVGEAPDVWIPLLMQREVMAGPNWLNNAQGNMRWLHAIGRLRPGATLEQAQTNADVVFKQILNEESSRLARPIPEIFKQNLKLHDGSTGVSSVRASATLLYVLMGIVAIVLAIACVNVAMLLLARAESRQKELGVRLAIGAGRLRIVRQLLTESLTLSVAGALLGTVFALFGMRLLTRTVLGDNAGLLDVRLDLRTLWFTLSVSVLTALLFGLAPAWRAARLSAGSALDTRARTGQWHTTRIGTGKVLAMGQIALSVVLLMGAGWFVRTLRNLETVDLGYPRQEIALLRVDFGPAGYAGERLPIVYEDLRTHLAGVPGISAVAYSPSGLLGDNYGPIVVEGYTSDQASEMVVKLQGVGPNHFSSVGIPVIRGREISTQDVASAPLVCVVNEAFAAYYFGTADPIGRQVRTGRMPYTIVGVTRDVRDTITYPKSLADNLRGAIPRTLYRPFLQTVAAGRYPPAMTYLIRTRDAASPMLQAVRKEVASFNAATAVTTLRSVDSIVDDRLRQERMVAQLASVFGGVALLLACVGLSGVLSYAVARRTHEIGIRMALGAERGAIIRMILRETMVLLVVGLVVGVPASLASARLVESQLFGLTAADPMTLVAALSIMTTVAIVAGYLPARRASTIDPLVALRNE